MENYDGQELSEFTSQFIHDNSGKEKVNLSRKEKKKLDKQLKTEQANIKNNIKKQENERKKKFAQQLKDREIELGKLTKKERKQRLKANNLVDFLGYNSMFENGICEVENGLYSETIAFSDVSYQSAREEDQRTLYSQMCSLYDSFGSDVILQFNIINTPLTPEELEKRVFFDVDKQSDVKLKKYAEIYQNILEDKQKEGVSNIKRNRYITYSVHAESPEKARPQLARVRNELIDSLKTMQANAHVLTGKERLEIIHSQLRPDKLFTFDYRQDIRLGLENTTKDFVLPSSIDFKPIGSANFMKIDDMYCQVLAMGRFGSELSDRVISNLIDINVPLNICWFSQGTDKGASVDYVKRVKTMLDSEIVSEQRNALKNGYDTTLLPAELEASKQDTEEVLDLLRNKNQRFYWFTGLVFTYAETIEKLQLQVNEIVQNARKNSVDIMPLEFRQKEGLNSILPLGHNHVEIERSFLTMQMGMLIPFATTEIDDGEGSVWVAQNSESLNLILNNRKTLDSPMGFVSGDTGSGKSFFVKNEIQQTILNNPDDKIIIVDPSGEYVPIVNDSNGQIIEFKAGGDCRLNPFDLTDTNFQSFEEQIGFKTEAMIASAGATAEAVGSTLDEIEIGFISAGVRLAFEKAKEQGKPAPLLEDYLNILESLGNEESLKDKAKCLAARYFRYISKPFDFFNAESNVNFSNRITDVTLKDTPDSMRPFALVTLFETVRNMMYSNDKKGVFTWLYVDEIQSMMKYPPVIEYLSRFVREGRKFGLIFTGITQTASSLLETKEARDIVKQANYIVLLKQNPLDRQNWVELLNLSKVESGYIGGATKAGNGLLISGGRHVPFTGNFPKNNDLYKLFNTDPNSKAK